jgi:putative two-component system response regulator
MKNRNKKKLKREIKKIIAVSQRGKMKSKQKKTYVLDLKKRCDEITSGHASRTIIYLRLLVEKLIENNLYAEETALWNKEALISSALLHDVGKLWVRGAILNKSAKFEPKEFEMMKLHVQVGVQAINRAELKEAQALPGNAKRFLERQEFFQYAKTIAGSHHEKWDGSGYPNGREGRDIPLAGRLTAIADVYDALVSNRSYKVSLTTREAEKIIESGRGTHFEPALVDIFNSVRDKFENAAYKIFEEATYAEEAYLVAI